MTASGGSQGGESGTAATGKYRATTTEIRVETGARRRLVDITPQVVEAVKRSGVSSGLCTVHSTHTTAGVTVNEKADPDVPADILRGLGAMVPDEKAFAHAEGNSQAHVMTSLVGPSVAIPVTAGRLALGRWQAVFLCEFDGPRTRTVLVTLMGTR